MELITINGDNENIIAYLEGDTLASYRFLPNDSVENIGEEIYKYFEFLNPNPQKSLKLPSEGNYEVILNLETNYKHYYQNGKQDLAMFFLNNGEEAISFVSLPKIDFLKLKGLKMPKVFEFKMGGGTKKRLTVSFAAFLVLSSMMVAPTKAEALDIGRIKIIVPAYFTNEYRNKDITIEDVKSWIDSADLTDEEKECLFDEQCLKDILPYVNSSLYSKVVFQIQNTGITTQRYGEENSLYQIAAGYVNSQSSVVHTRNDLKETDYPNVYKHEGEHLKQVSHRYHMLVEPDAELSSYEYEKAPLNSYLRPIKTYKKLIETIGTEPIRQEIYGGNDTLLRKCLGKHLTSTELNDIRLLAKLIIQA